MDKEKKGRKKRRGERIRSLNFIDVTQFNQLGHPIYGTVARSLDISNTGVRIECPDDFPIGANLELEMALKEEFLILDAKVIWKKKTDDLLQYGLEFTSIPEEKKPTLDKFIKIWRDLKVDIL